MKMIRKGLILVITYRIAHYCCTSAVKRFFFFPVLVLYHIIIRDILTFDIHEKADIGKNLKIWHGFGIAINPNVVIGDNVTLRHNITIGSKGINSKAPIIGNNVDIGPLTVIIGDIRIGNNVTIGAGSVVVKSIPDDCVVAGNPAKIIKYK